MSKNFALILLLQLLIGSFIATVSRGDTAAATIAAATEKELPLLRGVTIESRPYAERANGTIKGLVVDLMDKIAAKVGFRYELVFSPDGLHGGQFEHNCKHVPSMIGDVYEKRAHFAIADITVTRDRAQFVDFTEPIISNSLAAIMRRKDAQGLRSMEDLVNYNAANPSSPIAYVAVANSSTMSSLLRSNDSVGLAIHSALLAQPTTQVRHQMRGIDLVVEGRIAMIADTSFAQFISGINCNLIALPSTRSVFGADFAIALQRNSTWLPLFDRAIRELKQDGSVHALQSAYWSKHCLRHLFRSDSDDNSRSTDNEFSTNVDGFNV